MKKPKPTVFVSNQSSTSSPLLPVGVSVTSLSTDTALYSGIPTLDCTEEAGNVVHELIDLTPDPNPELPTNQKTQETREDRKKQREEEADSLH